MKGRAFQTQKALNFGFLNERILYKAESAGRLLDFIQADDDALDISTFRKQLVYLPNSYINQF